MLDIINAEIARREQAIASLEAGEQALKDTIAQFSELDEFYRDQEKTSREQLECYYKENRHWTGEQPIVYTAAQTEIRPFFGGATDALCNPYYPITKVQDNTFDGISPLIALITKTGTFQRQQTYATTEDIPRAPALTELQAFPDLSGEPLPPSFSAAAGVISGDQCYYAAGGDQPTCEGNGGIWGLDGNNEPDPVWVAADTAPALLRSALNTWRADLIVVRDDVCSDAGETAYWQGIIDDIDTVLLAVASDAVFVRNTGNADATTWGQTAVLTGADETARAALETAANTGIAAHVAARQIVLDALAVDEEIVFFGLIGLRLHQSNGSYAKFKAAKETQTQSDAIIADHRTALDALNLMKVKNS